MNFFKWILEKKNRMDDGINKKDQLPEEPPAIPMDQQDTKSDKVATGAMPPKKVFAAWVAAGAKDN